MRQLGLDEALRRGEAYLKAGADALFVEAPQSTEEVERIASTFRGKPLVLNMLEGGGKTPLLPLDEIHKMGFSMVFYPTSLIFVVAKALQGALQDIKAGRYPVQDKGLNFDQYEQAVGLKEWSDIETEYMRSATGVHAAAPSVDHDKGAKGERVY